MNLTTISDAIMAAIRLIERDAPCDGATGDHCADVADVLDQLYLAADTVATVAAGLAKAQRGLGQAFGVRAAGPPAGDAEKAAAWLDDPKASMDDLRRLLAS